MSTSSQLGVNRTPTPGIPNLLDYILPDVAETSSMPREYFWRLITSPPPTSVATSNSRACQKFKGALLA